MKIKSTFQRALIALTILVQMTFYPVAALAEDIQGDADPAASTSQTAESTSSSAEEEQPAASTEEEIQPSGGETQQQATVVPPAAPTPPASPTQTGPTSPTGADSGTYTFNSVTGLWENDLYTWNPKTGQTTPKTAQQYSYNPDTGLWDTTQWRFDAAAGKYVPNVMSVASPSAGGSAPLTLNSTGSGISNTGPGSNNSLTQTSNTNGFFNGFYNARVSNQITSSAHTGNAGVVQNTVGGSALSGDAEVMANILNMLQSSWDPNNGDLNTFVANIDGNVYGDLLLDPSLLITNNGGDASISRDSNTNLQVNDQASGRIDNDIVLDASSGNADVAGNNQAGDATSGDAKAVANIINLMNSSINAGESFIGVLNINGNLDGDILLPPWLMQSLIAATGPGSTSTIGQNSNQSLNANLTDNQTINNNVNAGATSGEASVANNTQAGSATTGPANTNVTILNLTGKKVVAKDAILVFVNVFGKWVGLIMDAPQGSSSAALGISNNGGDASISDNSNLNADINSTSDMVINNDVTVGARSGNASVHDNTSGGNARSGSAEAGVNIANIIGSEINLSGWFGVLFINVFGSWNGSFGVDTAAGGRGGGGASQQAAGNAAPAAQQAQNQQVFAFVPHTANLQQFIASTTDNQEPSGPAATGATQEAAVSTPNTAQNDSNATTVVTRHPNLLAPGIGLAFTLLLLGGERIVALIQTRRRNLV